MASRQLTCNSCFSTDLEVFHEADNVPANSCLLFDNCKEAQQYPRGKLVLALCRQCGFIGNVAFDPALTCYTEGYEEQQSFSPRFNAFAQDLAARLIERHNVHNKTVLEIGCGKGDFLLLLCTLGPNRGIGIDPTYMPGRHNGFLPHGVRFIRDLYSERYAQYTADLVCCRHTLEHIANTGDFVAMLRRSIGDNIGTLVFFELPDVQRVLNECAFWDIYYEHCSYFSLGSLARLFRRCGFKIARLAKGFDDQYLLLEAKPSNGRPDSPVREEETVEELRRAVALFQSSYRDVVSRWQERLGALRQAGRRVVIWGSGSKCVAFLNTIGINGDIDCVVDINPYRQGKYLPGSGKLIVAPEFLKNHPPDVVIAMNPIYLNEIRNDLNRFGLTPELLAV